ncbi:Hypothetical predicted protein [Marmota monax]|uniref:COX assembly mitochondrial protein 2 n=1 Tax=Marmota monax TaxID=9995 RepID=A0A5E4A1W4_MARMO|nr:COX assembly mitochondrial protein 2 [Marmota monax]VTJ51247.1 Hypothetical predicted protein [Marmota monax]
MRGARPLSPLPSLVGRTGAVLLVDTLSFPLGAAGWARPGRLAHAPRPRRRRVGSRWDFASDETAVRALGTRPSGLCKTWLSAESRTWKRGPGAGSMAMQCEKDFSVLWRNQKNNLHFYGISWLREDLRTVD